MKEDLAANLNLFTEVSSDAEGKLKLTRTSRAEDKLTLRFEMDTLVIMHNCPHPLCDSESYPRNTVEIVLSQSDPVMNDDPCLNLCDENRRGFQNNALYHLGMEQNND